MKIAITGGSGFIGSRLTKKFCEAGSEVLVLDQNAPKKSIPGAIFLKTDLINDFPLEAYLSCDAVVHLAGANIFGRWNKAYKDRIATSRIDTARALIDRVKIAGRGPKVFVSASAIGYYGDGGERELPETAPPGDGFLSSVCHDWEAAAESAEEAGMRWVSVRTGIVLGSGGGMLAKLIPVFKWGLGGPMGTGQQWFSWIAMEDLLSVYAAVVADAGFAGPVNAVSPEPVRNEDLVRALGRALRRPTVFRVPGFALRLILGELGTVVLMSQKVAPKILQERNFRFQCPDINQAIALALVSPQEAPLQERDGAWHN